MAKILVTEVDAKAREEIVSTLSDLGHEVLDASDGEEALAIVRHEGPDLVILDIAMPKTGGWEFIRELRRIGRTSPRILMLTSRSTEADFLRGWRLGVDEFMTKPFDAEELAIAVNETLMMTPEQIREKRRRELEKAQLLSRIESAFTDLA